MVECNLQLVDVSLELLLHAEQIALGLRLGIQGLLNLPFFTKILT